VRAPSGKRWPADGTAYVFGYRFHKVIRETCAITQPDILFVKVHVRADLRVGCDDRRPTLSLHWAEPDLVHCLIMTDTILMQGILCPLFWQPETGKPDT
jgi:hypothetical protein